MSSQTINQDKELAEFFTDVEHLRGAFKNSVAAPELLRRILVIYGVGGVGKSSLLRMFRMYCKNAHVPVALVSGDKANSEVVLLSQWANDLKSDNVALPKFAKTLVHYRTTLAKVEDQAAKTAEKVARETIKTLTETVLSTIPGIGPILGKLGAMSADALIDWLRGQGFTKPDIDLILDPAKKLTEDFILDIEQIAPLQRLVLMLDTFEKVTALEIWMCDFAQRLNANVLLVIAGRAIPNWDRQWPSWLAQANVESLEPMDREVTRELAQNYFKRLSGDELDVKQAEGIIEFARGLPIAITSAVDLMVKYHAKNFRAVLPKVIDDLARRLSEDVPEQLKPALQAAAMLRWFNEPTLRILLQKADVGVEYNELKRFPFVVIRDERFALHDAVRDTLDANLRMRDPELHCELHERAAAYFEKQLEKATSEESERLGLERLYHRIRADEETGIKLFQQTAEELARFMLVDQLRRLLNDANSYNLNKENSESWLMYYRARLARIDLDLIGAETLYQGLIGNTRIEPKLRAYAMFDLGMLLRQRRIGTPEMLGNAIKYYEDSLTMVPMDSKLVFSLMELGPIYRDRGEWEKGLGYINQALEFFNTQKDQYGLVAAYRYLRNFYIYRGDWRKMLSMHNQALASVDALNETTFLKSELLQQLSIAWVWAGLYSEAKNNLQESIKLINKLLSPMPVAAWTKRDQGYALCFANDFEKANILISESLATTINQPGHSERDVALALGFYGVLLLRKGDIGEAIKVLSQSADTKRRLLDASYLLETVNWLGVSNEILGRWDEAEKFYTENLVANRWTGRLYFICGSITGLVRVKHAQGDYAAIPPLLAEAEQLAQQYEYNDHLASLRLAQAHIAWEGKAPSRENGYDAVLHFYQQALIYALRYNRFLLDEVLSGRPQGSPLRPIISYCLERGEEGRKMLMALRDWWRTGCNDIGTPRPDTISPIPEGITLLEAEKIAREREPGDGSPQKSVVEQIKAALT